MLGRDNSWSWYVRFTAGKIEYESHRWHLAYFGEGGTEGKMDGRRLCTMRHDDETMHRKKSWAHHRGSLEDKCLARWDMATRARKLHDSDGVVLCSRSKLCWTRSLPLGNTSVDDRTRNELTRGVRMYHQVIPRLELKHATVQNWRATERMFGDRQKPLYLAHYSSSAIVLSATLCSNVRVLLILSVEGAGTLRRLNYLRQSA